MLSWVKVTLRNIMEKNVAFAMDVSIANAMGVRPATEILQNVAVAVIVATSILVNILRTQ